MPPVRRLNSLNILLRECYKRPHSQCSFQRRLYAIDGSSDTDADVANVAVLGSGITGLSTAFYLTREFPNAKITILDQSHRVGGWMQSSAVEIDDYKFNDQHVKGGKVIFEAGPRTLRGSNISAIFTLHLIRALGLDNEVIPTSRDSPAAKNRFIYYPDHLVRMPAPGPRFLSGVEWQEPVFDDVFKGLFLELFRPKRPQIDDESVGSFISRRFSPQIADNLVSAILHGIYAADVNSLSVRAIMPQLWWLEEHYRSIPIGLVKSVLQGKGIIAAREFQALQRLRQRASVSALDLKAATGSELLDKLQQASVYTFKGGLETLAKSLEKYLNDHPNVTFRLGANLQQPIRTDNPAKNPATRDIRDIIIDSSAFSHVLSTLPAPALSTLLAPQGYLPTIRSATLQVVNLYYADPNLITVPGFGYLLPRSVPFTENPEFGLGVIFDSATSASLDSVSLPGTKLTVMLGGHWWDSWTSYPTEEEGIAMAQSLLRRHLGIKDTPLYAKATLQRDCIPQYDVGHLKKVAAYRKELKRFGGRVRAMGNWAGGVGVNDCVMGAFEMVQGMKDGTDGTGLEGVAKGDQFLRFELNASKN